MVPLTMVREDLRSCPDVRRSQIVWCCRPAYFRMRSVQHSRVASYSCERGCVRAPIEFEFYQSNRLYSEEHDASGNVIHTCGSKITIVVART